MIRVTVDDPACRISSIDVLHESSEAVVLLVDLSGSAKRAVVAPWSDRTFWIGDASVTVHGDELGESILVGAETVKHMCIVTLARRREGREVYRA